MEADLLEQIATQIKNENINLNEAIEEYDVANVGYILKEDFKSLISSSFKMKMPQNDIMFLAKHYEVKSKETKVDMVKFREDLQQHSVGAGDGKLDKDGHTKSLRGTPLNSLIYENIIKSTRLQGELVEESFSHYTITEKEQEVLNQEGFKKSLLRLGIKLDLQGLQSLFKTMNEGTKELTPEKVDKVVKSKCKKTVEEMEIEVLQRIQKNVDKDGDEPSYMDKFEDADDGEESVPIETFKKALKPYKQGVTDTDLDFLCKRYLKELDDKSVDYILFQKEMKMLKDKINPIIPYAVEFTELYRRACYAKGYKPLEFMKKYSTKKLICDEDSFVKSFEDLKMTTRFKTSQAQKFHFYCDINRNNSITAKEIDRVMEKTSRNTPAKMNTELLEDVIKQLDEKGYNLKDFMKKLDRLSEKRMVDRRMFEQVMTEDMEITINSIDMDFLSQYYKDEKDNNLVRYSLMFDNINSIIDQSSHYITAENQKRIKGELSPKKALSESSGGRRSSRKHVRKRSSQKHLGDYEEEQKRARRHLGDDSDKKSMSSQISKSTKKVIVKLRAHVKKKEREEAVVNALYDNDTNQTGHISRVQVKASFHSIGLEIGDRQTREILEDIDTNEDGDYDYKQFLKNLLGRNYTSYLNEENDRREMKGKKRNNRSIRFKDEVAKSGVGGKTKKYSDGIDDLGERITDAGIDIEKDFTMFTSKGGSVTIEQVFSAFKNTKEPSLLLSATQRQLLREKVADQLDVDRDDKFSYPSFMKMIGLRPKFTGTPKGGLGRSSERGSARRSASKGSARKSPSKKAKKGEIVEEEDGVARSYVPVKQTNEKWCRNQCRGIRNSLRDKKLAIVDFFEVIDHKDTQIIPWDVFQEKLKYDLGNDMTKIATDDNKIKLLQDFLVRPKRNYIELDRFLDAARDEDSDAEEEVDTRLVKKYTTKIDTENKEMEVKSEFIQFLHKRKIPFKDNFGTVKGSDTIPMQKFQSTLEEIDYTLDDKSMKVLLECWKDPKKASSINIKLFKSDIHRYEPRYLNPDAVNSSVQARERLNKLPPNVRTTVNKLNAVMQGDQITFSEFFKDLDKHGEGTVSKQDFCSVITTKYKDTKLSVNDLRKAFSSLDTDKSGYLSYGELNFYLEGAKPSALERASTISEHLESELNDEIKELFQRFDIDGNNSITSDELYQSLVSANCRVSKEDVQNIIKEYDTDGNGELSYNEFKVVMMEKMKEKVADDEETLEEMRNMFLEADIDRSGYLDVHELVHMFQRQNTGINKDDVIKLMSEIDIAQDGHISLDQFIVLMMADESKMSHAESKNTLQRVKRSHKISPKDFLDMFKQLPTHSVKSFTAQQHKMKKILPSSAFVPKLNSKTLLLTDIHPPTRHNIKSRKSKLIQDSEIRCEDPKLAAEIFFDKATGVPYPEEDDFTENKIKKRIVRASIWNKETKSFEFNTTHVVAEWLSVKQSGDQWKFNKRGDNETNPIIFKTNLSSYKHLEIVFEFVTFVENKKGSVQQMAAAWCSLPVEKLGKSTSHTLSLEGGSPENMIKMDKQDFGTKMGVWRKFKRRNISSNLVIQVKSSFKNIQDHLTMMPSTCLFQKRLIHMLVGYRNYLGALLLKDDNSDRRLSTIQGDIVVVTLPRILDDPTLNEQFIDAWNIGVYNKMKDKEKMNVDYLVKQTEAQIGKMYLSIFQIGIIVIEKKKKPRSKSRGRKEEEPEEPQVMEFKPFNVKELDFDICIDQELNIDPEMKERFGIGSENKHPNKKFGKKKF